MPDNDEFTKSLITNQGVLNVNRGSTDNHELFRRDNQIAWIADIPASQDRYLAVFNLDDELTISISVLLMEIFDSGTCGIRDLWENTELGTYNYEFAPSIPPHGAGLYRLNPE